MFVNGYTGLHTPRASPKGVNEASMCRRAEMGVERRLPGVKRRLLGVNMLARSGQVSLGAGVEVADMNDTACHCENKCILF